MVSWAYWRMYHNYSIPDISKRGWWELHPIILIYLIFYRFPSFSYACKCVERCKDNVQPLYEINKETRNACKYCRYKACITLGGMQRKLVKKNQKIIRKDDSISIEWINANGIFWNVISFFSLYLMAIFSIRYFLILIHHLQYISDNKEIIRRFVIW